MSKRVWFAAIPITLSTAYLLWQHYSLTRRFNVKTTVGLPALDISLPKEIVEDPSKYVICHEHSSKSILSSTLPKKLKANDVLTEYLRFVMTKFAWSPQAYVMWYLIRSPERRETFKATHIQSLNFEEGDVVCGAYTVINRNPTKVEIAFGAYEGYTGPTVTGRIVISIEPDDDDTKLQNDVYMWRKVDEKPTLLESGVGQWVHEFFVGRLIGSGVMHLQSLARRN